MKKSITTLLSLVIMIVAYSQGKSSDEQPKGMVFIPQGSFEMNYTRNSVARLTHVTVDAFWMSNEITNKEFREFLEWAQKNPKSKLPFLKLSTQVFTDTIKGTKKDTIIASIIPIEVCSFNADMIDPLAMDKVNMDYKNYFTDLKYNNYPVVGVSYKMAQYYCLWKTMMENEQLEKKGLSKVQAYRLPLETEWEYVARRPLANESKGGFTQTLQNVNAGMANDWGLYHIDDNVSEWVTTKSGTQAIYRGGSWRSEKNISLRQICNPDTRELYIGFRIVRSYLTDKK